MTIVTRFTLPETQAAFTEWAQRTGCGWDSPEWGEMLAALDSCDLLIADRLPQRALFDPPDSPLGDGPQVRRLRAAILAAARLADWHYDAATTAQIAAAVLDYDPVYYDIERGPVEHVVTRLEIELPRRVRMLAAGPGAALGVQMQREFGDRWAELPPLALLTLDLANTHDGFAELVFDVLADNPDWRLALLALCDGRWALYECS